MKLKIFFISLLKLLVALAVNSANASPKKNTGLLSETMKSKVYLKIRLKEYESLPKNCKKLYDNRGPYKIRKHCKKKISVIISDLSIYKSKFEAMAYIYEKGLREDLEFSKIDI